MQSSLSGAVSQRGEGGGGGGGGGQSGKGQPSAEAFKTSNTDPVPSLEEKARKKARDHFNHGLLI